MTVCCFCAGDPKSADILQRRIGWESECFYVTPTVGELAADHLLLIPWVHVSSFANLPSKLTREAESIVQEHCALLSEENSKVLIFEHGMVSHSATGGCGISHAHIHLVSVPGSLTIGPLPEPDDIHPWVPVSADEYLGNLNKNYGYLLVGYDGKFWTRQVTNLPSQYLRRWIAGLLNEAQWDWRKTKSDSVEPRARRLRLRHAELVNQ